MLYDRLKKLRSIPMHMPGHKRNTALAPYLAGLRADLDITEIDGFDNLHGAEGTLAEISEKAAALWGSRQSFMLINGSSCGILAGIRALTHRGDKIIVARGAHKSVFHAIELCGLEPVFVLPPIIKEADIFGSLPPETVEKALIDNPDARLVVVTSPTYEGVISDIGGVCAAAHARGVPVLVDEAHGAHLGFSTEFCGGSVRAGADIVVQSLHKTLPSLTQTAIMHVCSGSVDIARIKHQLSVFETSSPSYLLMASVSGCIDLLEKQPQITEEWAERLSRFDEKIKPLEKLRIPGHSCDIPCYAFDRSKIPIFTGNATLSGYELADILRDKYGIEPEYAAPKLVLAMTGAGDTDETLFALADALLRIDAECEYRKPEKASPNALSCGTTLTLSPEQALETPAEFLPLNEAENRICAEYVWAYPPGVPLLIPGEVITAEVIKALTGNSAPELHSTGGKIPSYISVTS